MARIDQYYLLDLPYRPPWMLGIYAIESSVRSAKRRAGRRRSARREGLLSPERYSRTEAVPRSCQAVGLIAVIVLLFLFFYEMNLTTDLTPRKICCVYVGVGGVGGDRVGDRVEHTSRYILPR